MPAMNSTEKKSAPTKPLPLAVPLVLGLFLAIVLLIGHMEGRLGTPGKLVDSDCYMWLLRTEHLYNGAGWYDQTSPRSNAPYGETLHWGRPFDLVLLVPALTLTPFYGFHKALYLWGLAVAPVLLIPTAMLFVWALRPLLTRFQLFLACGLFLSNTAILVNFFPAQPDHKCLNTLLFTAAMGLSLRAVNLQFRTTQAALLGLVFAVGLWSSMEMLFAIVVLQTVLSLLWVRRGDIWAQRACLVSFFMTVFSSGALLLHRPLSQLANFENDSLSLLQLALLALLTIAWLVLWKFVRTEKIFTRFVTGTFAAIVVCAGVYWLHPTFFKGPFGDCDPEVRRIWMSKIQDTLPLAGTSLQSLAAVLYLCGMSLLALPTALGLAWRNRSTTSHEWLFLAIGLTAALGLSLFVADRCSTQAALFALGPLSVFLANLLNEEKWPMPVRLLSLLTLSSAGVVLSFLLVLFGTTLSAHVTQPTTVSAPSAYPAPALRSMEQLPTIELAHFLNGPEFPVPQRILTHLDLGAELMYRTPHEVIATPYHRNVAGILDDFHIMESRDDKEAEAIVQRRGVTLILTCPSLDEANTYYEADGLQDTLYERLLKNQPPQWLNRVELPPNLRGDFQLWTVSAQLNNSK